MKVTETTIRPAKMIGAGRPPRELLAQLFTAARAYNPNITGLTHVTPTHAVMQESRNLNYFLIEITPEQATALGYLEL